MATMRIWIFAALCGLGVALGVAPATAWAKQGDVVDVATMDALYAALSNASGGETIRLAPGEYGKFTLLEKTPFNINFATPVTITSADQAHPAVISWLDVRGASNLIFDGLVFDYTFRAGHPVSLRPFALNGCQNITLRNSTFDGDVAQGQSEYDNGLGYAFGLVVQGCSDTTIENNKIHTFYRGMVMGGGSGNVVKGNDLSAIRMDGMNFSQVQNVLIENNFIHDFARSKNPGDHSDMIQFWTNNTTRPSVGITIRGNVLMAGAGGGSQSIFMRNDLVDRGLAGREMFYRDVRIEENVIINGHLHGITLGEAAGVIIRNNTLLRNQPSVKPGLRGKRVTVPRINLKGDSVDVVIEGNLGPDFPEAKPGWTVRNNLAVQDVSPTQPGYYHKIFTNALQGDPQNLNDFAYLPGGPADTPKLGTALLRPDAKSARDKYSVH